jgi:hypothetical protein
MNSKTASTSLKAQRCCHLDHSIHRNPMQPLGVSYFVRYIPDLSADHQPRTTDLRLHSMPTDHWDCWVQCATSGRYSSTVGVISLNFESIQFPRTTENDASTEVYLYLTCEPSQLYLAPPSRSEDRVPSRRESYNQPAISRAYR